MRVASQTRLALLCGSFINSNVTTRSPGPSDERRWRDALAVGVQGAQSLAAGTCSRAALWLNCSYCRSVTYGSGYPPTRCLHWCLAFPNAASQLFPSRTVPNTTANHIAYLAGMNDLARAVQTVSGPKAGFVQRYPADTTAPRDGSRGAAKLWDACRDRYVLWAHSGSCTMCPYR